jgi:hypothetical protein
MPVAARFLDTGGVFDARFEALDVGLEHRFLLLGKLALDRAFHGVLGQAEELAEEAEGYDVLGKGRSRRLLGEFDERHRHPLDLLDRSEVDLVMRGFVGRLVENNRIFGADDLTPEARKVSPVEDH